MKNRKILIAAILTLALASASLSLSVTAFAASNYYICYESDNYRVRPSNGLTKDGEYYTVSPYLKRGDRFQISDNAGTMWGDAKGQPLVVTESGTHRYTVTFSPSEKFTDGSNVCVENYTPAEYELLSDGNPLGKMTYLRANAAREEYYFYAELVGGETITVRGKNGDYGENGAGQSGVSVPTAGKYRFAFTAQEDNLFEDGKYIAFEEYPTLYLLCEENNWQKDEEFVLERDEYVTYRQYKAKINVPQKNFELKYSVSDGFDGSEYKPSDSGKITVKDKGEYEVLYSPDIVYPSSGGFHTTVKRTEKFFDGWFVLGDFNDFEFLDGEDFAKKYGLVKDDGQTAYDEYTLNITVTRAMLDEFGGRVEFYVTDGADIYRRPDGGNIGISEAGEYKLTFSPTHDYGRGYRYRYEKIAEEIKGETVKITGAAQLAEILANCTSPEYSLNKTFELSCDVDLSGVKYRPALIFAGTFDGLYRTVGGIENADENNAFLFREITSDGCLKRATFEIALRGKSDNTALVGTNKGVIEQISVTGSVEGSGYVAAIAAVNSSSATIKDCVNSAEIIGVMNVGGVVGFNAGTVAGCVNEGDVNATALPAADATSMLNVGGIAGYCTGNILGSKNLAAVGSRRGRYIGGIAGLAGGGLFSDVNEGAVSGERYVGGIVGYYGRFSNDGESGGIGDYLGGGRFEEWLDKYFGSDNGSFEESEDNGVHEIYYCANLGDVLSDGYAGGIAAHAGAAMLAMEGCVSSGSISSRGSHAGGIVGELGEGRINGCIGVGEVIASREYAGGIVGEARGGIQNCLSSAYADASGFIGGIVGKASGAVVGCVSNAFAETSENKLHIGMIAGSAEIGKCSANFYLQENFGVGGIDGASYGSENSYAAARLTADKIMCEGMLSEWLVGLDSDEWLAGECEPRFPVPRTTVETKEPEIYSDKAQFAYALQSVRETLSAFADSGGKATVNVVFYTYDFDAEEYVRAKLYRIEKGTGIAQNDIPPLEEKERYFTWWDIDDFSRFDEDTRVLEMFDKAIGSLASDDSDKPLVIVEGRFRSDTKVVLQRNGEYIAVKLVRENGEETYDEITVKYYVGENDKSGIKLVCGSDIIAAETTKSGEYLSFTLKNGWAFAVDDGAADLTALWITLAAAGGALIAAVPFIIVIAVKHGRKRKKISENA